MYYITVFSRQSKLQKNVTKKIIIKEAHATMWGPTHHHPVWYCVHILGSLALCSFHARVVSQGHQGQHN